MESQPQNPEFRNNPKTFTHVTSLRHSTTHCDRGNYKPCMRAQTEGSFFFLEIVIID